MKRMSFPVCLMTIAAIYTSFMGTGCAHYRLKDKEVDESFSLKGTGREFSRGVTNIAFCWLELPREIECKIRDNNPDAPFGMISSSIAAALGAIKGTLWTVDRFVGGAVEIAFSPFPPYDPIMHPGYPPYLNFKKRKQSENPERLGSADQGDLPSTGTTHIRQDRADSHIEDENTCMEKTTRDIPLEETGTLELSNSNGYITICGWEGPGVRLKAEKKISPMKSCGFFSKRTGHFHDREKTREYLDAVKIEITGDEYYTRIKTVDPGIYKHGIQYQVNYEALVPSGAELKIKGCNGMITVTGTEGAAEISNSNGSIECRETSGKMQVTNCNGKITFHKPCGQIKAHSTNGSININELQLEYISGDICCKTSNGGIRISLPNESQYEVNATHINGKFECDFPIMIEEKTRGHIRGRVGEGGPKIEISTVNGSISIERI